MKKQLLATLFLFLASFAVKAQNDGVLIDYSVTPPVRDAAAIFQMNSTNQGILIPRMTYAQEQAIVSPPNGLMVYNTTSQCLDIYTGGFWQAVYCSCPNLQPLNAITGAVTVCSGTTQSYSVPAISGASSYAWTVTGVAPGSITGNGSSVISFTAPAINTYTVSVTASNACNTSSVTRSLVVNAYTAVPPTPVFNSTPTGLCAGGSYNYSIVNGLGSNGTGAIDYTWTITATGTASATLTANSQTAIAGSPVTYTAAATAITINSIAAAGNITVSVVGNNTCGTTVTPLSLTTTVDQFTTSNAGPDQTVCATSATFAGNTPISGGGTWTLVSGTGTITTPTSPASTVTGLGLGNNTFRWTLLNGSCTDSQDDVIIARNDYTASNAGPDQAVCATTATLAGNTPITGTGTWTLISGNGTITTPNSPTSGLTALGVGANTFRWTLLNGVCADSQDDVIITRDQLTTSNAGPDQTVCATSATLAGNSPVSGTGTWTVISGTGTFSNANSPTSDVTGLALGANTFRWTLNNGSCANSQDDVIITRNDFTTANAGSDQTVCATTATMAGNAPLTGTGTWTLVSGNGTITTPTSPTSGLTALGVGANTFRWTLLNGVCADSQDDVVITRDQLTNANAGPDQTVCATSATLAGNTPTTGTGTWTLISGTGTITNLNSPTSTVTGLGLGNNTFRWTLLNGTCTDSQDDVVIARNDFTSADAGPDQTFCGNSATLAGNTPITGGGTWTLVSGSGTITTPTSPTSTLTGLGVGANTFRWTLPNGACTDSQDDVVITSQNSSVAPTGITGTTTICSGSSTTLTVSGGSAGTGAVAEWFTGSCGGTSAGTGNSITVSPTVNTTYYVRYSGTCNTTTCASTTVTVDQFTTANAGPDQAVCATTATLAGNTPTTGGGTWTLVSGTGTITTPSSPTSGVTGLGVGANTFRWTLPNGACTNSQDDVVITGQNSSVAPTAITGTTTICSGSSTTLTVSGGSAGTGAVAQWFTGSCGGTSAGTGNSITVSPTVNTTYYVRYSGTCNTTTCASTTVTVDQFTTANAGPDQAVCATTATLAGNTPTTGGGTWTLVSGTGTITTPSSPTSGVTGLGVGANTFRWTLLNGACTDSQDNVVITGQSSSVAPTSITGTSTICNGSSTTLTVSGGSAGTGAVAQWFTGSCGGTSAGTGNSISVSPSSNGTYYVRYAGTCNTTTCASQLVTVNFFTTATAGSDQAVCATTATLAGNAPTTGTGTWTVVGGSGTITTPTSPTSGITSLGVGANTFRWTLPNGVCTDSQDDVIITGQSSSVAPTGISGNTSLCYGYSTTLTLTGGSAGTGATAQWFTGSCGGTFAGTGNSITVAPTSTTTYYVRYAGTCNTTSCASTTVTVTTSYADPGPGANQWNVVGWDGGTIDLNGTCKGYYVQAGLNYDTGTRWGALGSPSDASGWNGCPIPIDNHIVVSKRTGFTAGTYRIDVASHDDDARLYINGVLVWSHEPGCCDSHTNAWTGTLNAASTVEFRHREYGGGSYQALNFTVIPPVVSCTHTLNLYDTWGDGWNGNTVSLYVGGSFIATLTLNWGVGPGVYNFTANEGQSIQVIWNGGGSWQGEVYFSVRAGTGSNLVTNWFPYWNGSWSGTGDCP
jgi:hypothetical protein